MKGGVRALLAVKATELATNKSNKYNAFGLFDLRFFSARFDLFDLLSNQRPNLFDLICV
jgi:hypothetical protein